MPAAPPLPAPRGWRSRPALAGCLTGAALAALFLWLCPPGDAAAGAALFAAPLARASAKPRTPTVGLGLPQRLTGHRPHQVALAAAPTDGLPEALDHSSQVASVAAANLFSWAYDGPALVTAPAPSGINTLPAFEQQLWFFACMAIVLAGTVVVKKGLLPLTAKLLPQGWYRAWTRTLPLIGATYALAGVGHFLILGDFANIYPPPGAWGGLWQLPGTADFHVAWTGVVELFGGLALLSSFFLKNRDLAQYSALALLILTIAVTPANIYMFTHGAQLPPGIEVPISGHVLRAVLQMVLLGVLWEVVVPTPDGEEVVDRK